MKANLHEFTIGIESDLVTPESPNYRPLSWPPSRDWAVVIDKDGVVVSRWGDSMWDLSPWAGKWATLNFGDGEEGQGERLDADNADVMRMVATWLIWGPRAAGRPATVLASFSHVRQIVALCSRNGISAGQLMRFPKVLERLPEVLMPSKHEKTIALLHRLYDAREELGFIIVDSGGLRRLAAIAPDDGGPVQTPYIPPRIWTYQVERLRECVTDFLAHREQVELCFRFCLDAYAANYGSLQAALSPKKHKSRTNPFSAKGPARFKLGTFSETAARFGIAELLNKWAGWGEEEVQLSALSTYLTIVSWAALAYIGNFTLQRKEEIGSLRTSCLRWEEDEKLGRVPIICGETTKTDPDSDARWVTSPSVEGAVEAASAIARLRMLSDRENPFVRPTAADQDDPYMYSAATEPWIARKARPYTVRSFLLDIRTAMDRWPRLFDQEQLRITGEDLKVALRLTPNLQEDEFAVGKVWPLAWHQYRRTGAVNMFASGVISDSTMQQHMKHCSRLMPLYYGRNHTRLRLNEDTEGAVVRAMYEAQAERIKHALSGDRFVSPHSQERKEALAVNVLSVKDAKALAAMAKKGTISYREHRLGGCMKAGACEYGGFESVARCAGGDGGKPCIDVVFDRTKEPQVRADVQRVTAEIERLPVGSPRYNALIDERHALENSLNVVSAH